MSRQSNIILRNNFSRIDRRSMSTRQGHTCHCDSLIDPNPISNPRKMHFLPKEDKHNKSFITKSKNQCHHGTKLMILERDSLISKELSYNKPYDSFCSHVSGGMQLETEAVSFCYSTKPRGGIIPLGPFEDDNNVNDTIQEISFRKSDNQTQFACRRNNRSFTVGERKNIIRPGILQQKPFCRVLRDKMKEIWKEESTVSTIDSFQLESNREIRNEGAVIFKQSNWSSLQEIEREISFNIETVKKMAENKAVDYSLISPKEILHNWMEQLQIETEKEDIGRGVNKEKKIIQVNDEEEEKPKFIKGPTKLLKSGPKKTFLSKRKTNNYDDDDEEENNDILKSIPIRNTIDQFDIFIPSKNSSMKWDDLNQPERIDKLSLPSLYKARPLNDQFYFIQQKKDTIVKKVLISSNNNISESFNDIFSEKKINWNTVLKHKTADLFTLNSLYLQRFNQIQLQQHLCEEIIIPHLCKTDSFTYPSICSSKTWDPVQMRKENQERIDFIIEKSVLHISKGNRHIKELYRMEYDEMTDDNDGNRELHKKCPTISIQNSVINHAVQGISHKEKWFKNNKVFQVNQLTILNQAYQKWTNDILNYNNHIGINIIQNRSEWNEVMSPFTSTIININKKPPVVLNTQDNDENTKTNQMSIANKQDEKNRELSQNKQGSFTYDINDSELLIKKAKTYKVSSSDYFNYLNNDLKNEERKENEMEKVLSIMRDRWNMYSNHQTSENVRLNGKGVKKILLYPYQSTNFNIVSSPKKNLRRSIENIIEIATEGQLNMGKSIEYHQSCPIMIQCLAKKKKKKKKIKAKKPTDDEIASPSGNEDNDIVLLKKEQSEDVVIKLGYSNENQSKENEDLEKMKHDLSKKRIDNNDCDPQKHPPTTTVLKSQNKRTHNKNALSQSDNMEPHPNLTYTSKIQNHEMISLPSCQKHYNETCITKSNKKRSPQRPIKQINYNFNIYTKDQGIQNVQTNLPK